jgi:hypothetical protein
MCAAMCDESGTGSCGAGKACRGIDSSIGGCWCDVAAQTGCPTGQACYYFDGCRTPGKNPGQGDCVKDSDCVPGNLCLPLSATESVCRQLCDQATMDCPDSLTCTDAMTLGCPRLPTPPPVWVCMP